MRLNVIAMILLLRALALPTNPGTACAADDTEYAHPVLRVPKLVSPPELDGRLQPGEWDGAAALSGLVNYGMGWAVAPGIQQATFYLAYDDTRLYLAMNSPNPPGAFPMSTCARADDAGVLADDHIEWQILKHPRAKAKERGFGFFKIAVNALGTQLDQWLFGDTPGTEDLWSAGGTTTCSVTPEAWQLELSVSLEKLGINSLDGQSWVMQLVRSDPGGQNRAYLGWAPGTWLAWDAFAEVHFDPDAPAVQVTRVGELSDGKLDAHIAVRAIAAPRKVHAAVSLIDADGNELLVDTRTNRMARGAAAAFHFERHDLALSETGNTLRIDVLTGDKVLYRNRMAVNRLDADQRHRFIDEWTALRGDRLPEAEYPAAEETDSLLATLAATKRRLRPLESAFAEAVRNADLDRAGVLCRKMTEDVPSAPGGYYNLACLHALRGNKQDAFAQLQEAIARGFSRAAHIEQDPDLQALRDDPRFAECVRMAGEARPSAPDHAPQPFAVERQTAWVADGNVGMHDTFPVPVAQYSFAPGAASDRKITNLSGKEGDLLREWYAAGTAAGNWGDLYDNRDNDHSSIQRGFFPQLTWVEYSDHARDAGLNWGLAGPVLQDGVAIGNASVAQTSGPYWRSMTRMAYTSGRGIALLHWQYMNNQVYVYPSHVDYRPGGKGDTYPANTPYVITSLGSSGSDKAFLRALAATMAAFRPDVKRRLVAERMLAPTLQYIFRASNKPVAQAIDYLDGAAHPPVFKGADIDVVKMVTTAHEMTSNALPPLVQLEVEEEDRPANGRNFFTVADRTEVLFDTPCAIARVFRGVQRTRRMVVSAAASRDLNDLPLAFRWVVLQGDAGAIHIRPLDTAGTRAELVIPWQPRRPVRPGAKLESNRIDIGCFAENGVYTSAPAFITFFALDHEDRTYGDDGRILSVSYTGADDSANYVDPMVAFAKSWRDEYHYDRKDLLTGWTRARGDEREEFDSAGRLLLPADEPGQPPRAVAVRYAPQRRDSKRAPVLVQVIGDEQ